MTDRDLDIIIVLLRQMPEGTTALEAADQLAATGEAERRAQAQTNEFADYLRRTALPSRSMTLPALED